MGSVDDYGFFNDETSASDPYSRLERKTKEVPTGTLYCKKCKKHHAVSNQIKKYKDANDFKCDDCNHSFW